MPRENGLLLRLCLVLLVILGGAVIITSILLLGGAFLVFPIPATAAVILEIVAPIWIIALHIHRTPRPKTDEGKTEELSPAVSPVQVRAQEMQASSDAMPRLVSTMYADSVRPDVQTQQRTTLDTPRTETEKRRDSVESLQARINELEERARWLRERLAAAPTADATTGRQTEANGKPSQTSATESAEEVSARALQQLLEALDEKLAKRAISQQLYQRLRDKYLARLSRAQGKREAEPKAVSGKPRRRR